MPPFRIICPALLSGAKYMTWARSGPRFRLNYFRIYLGEGCPVGAAAFWRRSGDILRFRLARTKGEQYGCEVIEQGGFAMDPVVRWSVLALIFLPAAVLVARVNLRLITHHARVWALKPSWRALERRSALLWNDGHVALGDRVLSSRILQDR